jgi:asparagine synthase (glutamine-hydrolysing)
MCGITGVVDFKNKLAARHLGAMTHAVHHRGPDDEGYACFRFGNPEAHTARGADTPAELANLPLLETLAEMSCDVALGHRRLSILDLSPAGHNPLPNADCTLWLTYNGEIYNYLELRAELSQKGHTFRTATDTEVLLAAYQEWGTDCLSHFNGMYAIAIWDTQQERLFCARDRFGVKPFYYAYQDGLFAFGSEIKALLANPEIRRSVRPQAVYDYLVNGAIPAGAETFFDGIQQIPGGHALTLNRSGQLNVWRYYELGYQTNFTGGDFAEKTAQFYDLLTDAVRLRLRSDVAVGSALSGGLDSSSVVTLISSLLQGAGIRKEIIGDQQKVFCAVHNGEAFNEKPFMDTVINATGAAAHFTHPTRVDLQASLEKMIWHQDEPFNSTSIFAQYCVMRLARENGVTVLLDGQAGDEVLAGYPFYYGYYLAQSLRAGRPDRFAQELFGIRRNSSTSWAALMALTAWNISPAPLRSLGWRMGGSKMLSHKAIPRHLVDSSFAARYDHGAQIKHNAHPTLAEKLHEDVLATNLPALLRYEDRNSMAFHIETRLPFMDYRLVEFAFSLSADMHIRDGWSKAMLRESMRGRLPESIRLRKDKEGYTTPHDRWMRELTPQINDLFSGEVHSEAYLSPDALAELKSPNAGSIPGVWRLINLESWLRVFELA